MKSKHIFAEQNHKLPAKMSLWYEQSDGLVYGKKIGAHDGTEEYFTYPAQESMWWEESGWGPGGDDMQYNNRDTQVIMKPNDTLLGVNINPEVENSPGVDSPNSTTQAEKAFVAESPHSPRPPPTSGILGRSQVRGTIRFQNSPESRSKAPHSAAFVATRRDKGAIRDQSDTIPSRMAVSRREEPDTRLYLSSEKAIAAQHVMSKGREDARLREQKWFVDLTQELYRHAMTGGYCRPAGEQRE